MSDATYRTGPASPYRTCAASRDRTGSVSTNHTRTVSTYRTGSVSTSRTRPASPNRTGPVAPSRGTPRAGLVLLAFAILATCGVRFARALDPVALLPPDVVSAVVVRDAAAAAERVRMSPLGRARDGAGPLAPLLDTIEGDSRELSAILSSEDSPERALFVGALALAKLPPARERGGKGDSQGFLFVFEHGGDAEAIARYVEPRPRRDERVERSVAEADGLRYLRIRRIRTKSASSSSKSNVARLLNTPGVRAAPRVEIEEEHVYVDRRVMIRASADGEPIREALRRLREPGRHATLADSPRRAGALAGISGPADVELFYDFAGLAASGDPLVDEELLGRGGDARALGIDEIRAAAVAVRFLPDRLELEGALHIPEPRRGAGRLFFMNRPLRPTGAPPEIARLVPPDATAYALHAADVGALWREFRALFQRGAPGVLQLADDYLNSLQGGLDENVLTSMIDNLGGHWALFVRPSERAAGRSRLDSTYVLELRPGHDMRPVLERWLGEAARALNYRVEKSEVGERIYYRLAGAEVSAGAAVDLERLAKACLTDRHLLFSPRFEHIEAALASAGRAPAPRPEFLPLVEAMDPERSLELCATPDSLGTLMDDPILGLVGNLLGGLKDSLLASAGPGDKDDWRRTFGPATGEVRAREDRLEALIQFHWRP